MTGAVGPPGPGGAVGPLRVRGGPGGTSARLEDLEAVGRRLLSAGRVVAGVAGRAGAVLVDPILLAGAVFSPATWLVVERGLVAAVGPPGGAAPVAARLVGLGEAALGAVAVYRSADVAADASVQAVDVAVGRFVGGTGLVPLAALVGGADLLALATLTGQAPEAVVDRLLELAAGHVDAFEHVVDAMPGVLGGALAAAVPGLPALVPTVPATVPAAARWIGDAAGTVGWLRETGVVTVEQRRPVPVAPPGGLADLIGGIATLDPDVGARPGTVRVVSVTGPDGRRAWIVQIPGTQSWSPKAGSDPLDLTGNVRGMAGGPTAGRLLVEAALRSARVPPGEPLLLAGHSQGGLVAAHLAADPVFRSTYHVTHVVTAGSPVAQVPVPGTVAVLALEHDEDIVPRTDGAANPDRAGWLTVSAPTAVDAPVDPGLAHRLSSYEATAAAVDTSEDPGLVRWREGLAPFLAGPGVAAVATEVSGVRSGGGG